MMTTEFMCIQIMTDNQGRLKKVTTNHSSYKSNDLIIFVLLALEDVFSYYFVILQYLVVYIMCALFTIKQLIVCSYTDGCFI